MPRAKFVELGGYPLGFKVCEDVHFLIRLVARSRRIGVVCAPLGVYLIHDKSATRRDPVAAQRENVRTLLDLERQARAFPEPVRQGVKHRCNKRAITWAARWQRRRSAVRRSAPCCRLSSNTPVGAACVPCCPCSEGRGRMNRLLVITELFLPTKGGTAVWAAEVYRRMGGKEIHIVTADVPGASVVDAAHPNTIHRVDLRRVPWLRPESLAMYGRLFFKSLRLLLARRFDAVHAFRALPEGLVAWSVARLTSRPVAIYAHGEELTTWGHGGKYKAMRFVLRHADRVVANSEHTRDTLLEMGICPDKISRHLSRSGYRHVSARARHDRIERESRYWAR